MNRALVITVLICSFGFLSAQEDGGQDAPAYPRGPAAIPLLREVWRFGADNIYPGNLAERFDAQTLIQLEEMLQSNRTTGLADVLNPFLESLGVSHTRFYDRRHQSYYMLRSLFSTRDLETPKLYTIGVQLDDKDPGIVRAIMEGSPSAAAGLRRGERIVAVDGEPFDSLLQWQRPGPIRLTIEADIARRNVELVAVRQSFHKALARATAASQRVISCNNQRIGYLHLWSGTHEVFLDSLKNTVASARDAKLDGFVLDLRDGYGGAWWPYLDPFFPSRENYFTASHSYPDGEPETSRAAPQINPDAWEGPLAVIINSGTRSGKESLAFQFKQSGRAKLFGSATSGAFTGGLGAYADRDVNYFLFLSVQETRLDGVAIEGIGVSPDVVVPEETSNDAPLAAALDQLACQIETK